MESALKYFETKYNLKQVICLEEKTDKCTKFSSISKLEEVQLLFTVIVDYYCKNEIQLDYSDKNVDNLSKYKIMQNVSQIMYKDKAIKLYDLLDFMFKSFINVIINSEIGFVEWIESAPVRLRFDIAMTHNIHLFFYIIFFQVFPEELKTQIKKKLKISDLDYNIIGRCNGIIISNDKRICNINNMKVDESHDLFKFLTRKDETKNNYIKLSSKNGITTLLNIFNILKK